MEKTTIRDNETRKYKINECLLKLSAAEHRLAVQRLPGILNISLNTLHNYRNILLGDTRDIPHEKVVLFEQLFELRRGELLNKPVQVRALKELLKVEQFKRASRMPE